MDESCRWIILSKHEYNEAWPIINRMNEMNGNNYEEGFTNNMKIRLLNWTIEITKVYANTKKASISSLFIGELALITSIIWANWFI